MTRVSKKKNIERMVRQKIYHVGIYARLSVDNHNEKNESIETQLDIAKLYIKDKPEFELYHCYIDLGKSGVHFERDGFKQLMMDIREGKVNCVIVKDFSRFGRNYIETGNFIQKIFPFLDVRFISVTDGFDSNCVQTDDFGVNLKNLVNEMYAADIAAKVKSTRISQQKNGSYTGGYAPYGYHISKIDGKRVLVVEEAAADIIRALFNQYEAGNHYKELIKWLYKNKIHRPTEYRKYKHIYCREGEILFEWSKWTLKSIFTNPVYMGCLIQGTCEAIVSREQFLKIACQFEKQSLYYRNHKNNENPSILLEEDIFNGILFCGNCHCKMKRKVLTKNLNHGEKKRSYIYDCPNANRMDIRKCSKHPILLETLQELIKESLKKEWLFSNIKKQDIIKYLKSQFKLKQNLLYKNREDLKRKIENCKIRQSEQYLKYQSGRISLQTFKKVQEEHRQQTALLSKNITIIENQQNNYNTIFAKQKIIFDSMLKWDILDRELLHILIKEIDIFSDKRVEIIFDFQESNSIKNKKF